MDRIVQFVMTELAAEPGVCYFSGAVPSCLGKRALACYATLHLGWIRRERSAGSLMNLLHMEVRSENARAGVEGGGCSGQN